MNYKVTYASDYLDPNPIIKTFDSHYDMEEWVHDEVQRRIEFQIEHSPFSISEKEYREIEEYEYSLIRMEEITNNKVELINDDLFGETITGYSIY